MKSIRSSIMESMRPITDCQRSKIGFSEAIKNLKARIEILQTELIQRRISIIESRCKLQSEKEYCESRTKRFTPKQELQVPFATFINNPSLFDNKFSTLHPFHKLRGLAHSLAEERRLACMSVLSMYRFRFINIQNPPNIVSSTGSSIITELVGDFDALDGSADQLHVVLLFLVPVLILLTRILDIPIPFPIVYGTLVSSPNLHSPISALETGCPSYPRILHAYKRVLSPLCTTHGTPTEPTTSGSQSVVGPVVFRASVDLLIQDLHYMHWLSGAGGEIMTADPIAILSAIVTSPNLGRIFTSQNRNSPKLSPLMSPSSPGLSGVLNSCAASPMKRPSMFEQSIAEGGEWTLLDQL